MANCFSMGCLGLVDKTLHNTDCPVSIDCNDCNQYSIDLLVYALSVTQSVSNMYAVMSHAFAEFRCMT